MVLSLLGESKARILNHLKERGAATVPDMAEAAGLNVETVRAHLRSLSEEGLVRRVGSRSGGRGRPEVIFGLTDPAQRLFPDRGGTLLLDLIPFLREEGEGDLLEAFYKRHSQRRLQESLDRVDGLGGRERVEEVVRILKEDGYLAEVQEEDGGRRVLRIFHCPIRELVSVDSSPCRHEIGLVRALLGDHLTRVGHMPSGDPACAYAGLEGSVGVERQ